MIRHLTDSSSPGWVSGSDLLGTLGLAVAGRRQSHRTHSYETTTTPNTNNERRLRPAAKHTGSTHRTRYAIHYSSRALESLKRRPH
jgi:hypothetical protein